AYPLHSPPSPTSAPVVPGLLYGPEYHGQSSPADINRVTNSTLGFSKIFVIGLPERTDKRDAMTLTSSLTGFNLEWIDGVKGEAVPDKAIPFGKNRDNLPNTYLGSWRSHMNAIRRQVLLRRWPCTDMCGRIVEEDLESALIMEDDMDWDVRLRSQLETVAKGTRALLSSGSQPNSPYGDSWDLLWLGHCGEIFPEQLPENKEEPLYPKFAIKDDQTVPPLDKITGLVDFKSYPEFTRWVHVTGAPICSFAYALTRRGAQKVLFDLSKRGSYGVTRKVPDGYTPVFFHHRPKGLIGSESDIVDHGDESQKIREKGTSENIMWSARNNIRNMLMNTKME
ncbi:glycosyltransferase family 25 protein, partial [Apiospora hydei]